MKVVRYVTVNGVRWRLLSTGEWQWQTPSIHGDWAFEGEDMYAAAVRLRWS